MKNLLNRSYFIWSALALGAMLSLAVISFVNSGAETTKPSNERLVTIHDRGSDKVIVTNATTVQKALKQAHITVRPDDNVDPKPSTPLTANSYQINVYRAQPVLVIDGNVRRSVMTSSETPRQIMAGTESPLFDEDTADLSRSSNVLASEGAGLQLTIHRATRFTLVLYGKPIEARTQEKTVAAMLQEKNITLAGNDTVSIPLTTPIVADMKVEVWRNGKQTLNEEQPVAFPTQQIQSADQPVGYKAVQTPGVMGKKNVSFEVEMQNGKEVSRHVIQEVVILQPQAQVEVVGTKPTFTGDFGAALSRLRACEAGGAYTRNSGNGFYGAYQYDVSTWGGYGGYTYASDAPASVQDQKVWETYQRRGWSPWPSCGASLPDTYR